MRRLLAGIVCSLLCVSVVAAQSGAPEGAKVGDIDHSIDPCQDFDAYANGAWRAAHSMPAVQTRWARRSVTQDETLEKLHPLLEDSSSKKAVPGSTDQLIGDFYGACMDEAHINSLGLKTLEPELARIDAIKDSKDLANEIVELQRYGIDTPLRLSSEQDPHSPTDVIADLDINGMGLPDRDYYLRDEPRFKDIREKYVLHMQKMFTLAGYDEEHAKEAAAAVLRFETKLATAKLTRVRTDADRCVLW